MQKVPETGRVEEPEVEHVFKRLPQSGERIQAGERQLD
jgi:hypothetical protein